jgi:hypothetical protein
MAQKETTMMGEQRGRMTQSKKRAIYCTTYCNFGHYVDNGRPVKHECRVIPPAALKAEMAGDYERAIEIMTERP